MAVSGVGTTTNDTAAANATSRTQLASNYNTFLTLLTSQLQNQDPLAPMDSTQFTQQLVQFSQVEQQIRTNEQLEGLVGQYQASTAGAALSYLGRDAIIKSDTAVLADGKAAWAYNLGGTADTVTLTVRDSHNRDVFTTTGEKAAGDHLFSWDGKNADGSALPAGNYKLVVTAKNADGVAITSTTSVRETIMGVDFSGTTPLVITPAGSRGLDSITAVINN